MGTQLYLNDLLLLDAAELENTKIKFNQRDGKSNTPSDDPMELYKKNPDKINIEWFLWRETQRYFTVGQTAICFLKLTSDTWLLTTIKKITKDLDVIKGINYEGEEIKRFEPYFGRVIIKYHKTHQTQGVFAKNVIDQLEVVQILPSVFDGEDFPGYDNVRLSFSQLETIIERNNRTWIPALENQKAVYLITDISNGKMYVGSAYGDNGMLLARWSSYIQNGHGGNTELIDMVNRLGFDYIKKNFQYSILENYNARVDKHIILRRENWWKDTLGTRIFGYNNN